MGDYDESLKVLQNEPSVKEIQQITQKLLEEKHGLNDQVQIIHTYILHVFPVYSSLKNQLQLQVRRIFYSCIGISNLINQFKLSKNEIYLKVMRDLMVDPVFLVTIVESAKGNRMEMNQVKSLFFGSKIFNVFEGKFNLDDYLKLLAKQLVQICRVGQSNCDFFIGYLSIHPIESKLNLFSEFLTDANFQYLVSTVGQMNDFHKKSFFIKHFFPYLETLINTKNLETGLLILKDLSFQSIELNVAKYLGDVGNLSLQKVITYHFKNHFDVFRSLLQIWGNEQYIKDMQEDNQEYLTKELLILAGYLTQKQLKDISTDRIFLDAITARLSVNDARKRDLGIIIAKIVTNNEINLTVENEIIVEKLPRVNLSRAVDFSELTLSPGFGELTISQKETEIVDSDDEEYESQDETEPVFLKDLVVKLSSDNARSITRLLKHTIKLVRQKATFKLEIEFYSEELITLLIGLTNKYDEADFEELKLNAIVSVIVTNPPIISHVMKLLFTGDYSLQQRMVTLSSISLAARELRGFEDDVIDKPKFDFPTSEIESRKKNLVQEVKTPRFEEIEDEGENSIMDQGRVIRMSSKLTKPKTKLRPNNFSKIAPKFFYPLANGWIEGINIGHYNEMFLKHYLKTMQLIINAAYPCHEFETMAELFTEILNSSSVHINI